jgi:Zn-dependent M28 family amino/carboxypeptidase
VAHELHRVVEKLAGEIKERNLYRPENLKLSQEWIEEEFKRIGYVNVRRLPVPVKGDTFGLPGDVTAWNIEAILPGSDPDRGTIVIGAHYDSKVATPGWHDHRPPLAYRLGTPGANDNASGVAAVLSMAAQLKDKRLAETVRFVAFVNEEPPFYQTQAMGSLVYAKMLRDKGVRNVRMITPETLGCYSVRLREKRYGIVSLFGLPDYPNYAAFLGNLGSQGWINQVFEPFSGLSRIEARTLALPELSNKVAWSDDWSFWQHGFPAFTVTDTAFLRHDDYHELNDVPQNLDYDAMAEVVWALGLVIEKLAGAAGG